MTKCFIRKEQLTNDPPLSQPHPSPPRTIPTIEMSESTVDWDHKTVIGNKIRPPRVARNESQVIGTSSPPEYVCLCSYTPQPFVHFWSIRLLSYSASLKARRQGAHVVTDRRQTGGTNKAHQSMQSTSYAPPVTGSHTIYCIS
jgi:hypothetical protein